MTRAPDADVAVLARAWAADLALWAIPEEILEAAPESPWGFPVEVFERVARDSAVSLEVTPSRRRALEALQPGATVLDVGAGAGAAGLALAPPAGFVTAVDESPRMLEAFSGVAGERGVAHDTVAGRWPDVAGAVPVADVVVCHHVAYNVADIEPFVRQLDLHARSRVVMEVTEAHPLSDLNAAWKAIHGLERPGRPVADDLVNLIAAMGIDVRVERFLAPPAWAGAGAQRVAMARRRLCVGADRDEEIARLLPSGGRRLVTIWWDKGP